MGVGKRIVAAALSLFGVMSLGSVAYADAEDSHSVAYNVLSFRFLELSLTDGESAAVDFTVVRQGDAAEVAGGTLYYATSLPNDKVVVAVSKLPDSGADLGVFVSNGIGVPTPCISVGTKVTGAPVTLALGGVANNYVGADPVREPVALDTVGSSPALITGIGNCGNPVSVSAAYASIYYVLDAKNLDPTWTPTAAGSYVERPDTDSVTVTYTLKATS